MSEEEQAAFFELPGSVERAGFAQAFWRNRGDEAAERWGRNREDVRRLGLESTERRVALLLGKPSRREAFPRCGGLRRIEVWTWEPPALAAQGASEPAAAAVLALVRAVSFDKRSLRPWRPGDLESLTYPPRTQPDLDSALDYAASSPCFETGQIDRLREALAQVSSFDELRRRMAWPAPTGDWLATWRQRGSPHEAAAWPDARLEIAYPGSFNDQTIVAGRLVVRSGRLHQLGPGQLFDRVTITGDVTRGSHLADSFEITHHVAGTHAGPSVPLELYRRLRPGEYTLDLRAVDRHGLGLLALRTELRVPEAAAPAPPPAGRARGYSHLTRPDVVVLTTFPGVELLPASVHGGGRIRLHASTTGGPIDAVEFRLDGGAVAIDGDPPYSALVDGAGDRRRVEAIALDPVGRPLARHQRWLEPETRAFSARFAEPAGDHVPVAVSLPAGASIARLDCLRGRRSTARLTAPPWRCPLPPRFAPRADYLTARVTLAGGETAEDVIFLGPGVEKIDVRLAELYLTVVDSRNRPVDNLEAGDFRLRDASGPLVLESAESLANLPLNVALLMDVSSSMGREVRLVAASAQRFFETILRPGDLAAIEAFNHDLHPLAPFTGDTQRLRHASAGLRASGSTRLHDAVIHALFQFSGLDNRRALVVLSDGEDVGSDYPFEQVADEAVRAGVVVYPVFLGAADGPARDGLRRLARQTGGRDFSARGAAQLDGVLRQIADELRAQYLLVFRPRARASDVAFRNLEVELLRPGLEARDIHGHYR
jgi:VWFA-related protein